MTTNALPKPRAASLRGIAICVDPNCNHVEFKTEHSTGPVFSSMNLGYPLKFRTPDGPRIHENVTCAKCSVLHAPFADYGPPHESQMKGGGY